MMGIDFMAFSLSEADIEAKELGIDVAFNTFELQLYTFYSIDYITVIEEEPNYTIIGSNGYEFICNERYDVVKQRIQDVNVLRFN
jgi:hypothetical protein